MELEELTPLRCPWAQPNTNALTSVRRQLPFLYTGLSTDSEAEDQEASTDTSPSLLLIIAFAMEMLRALST